MRIHQLITTIAMIAVIVYGFHHFNVEEGGFQNNDPKPKARIFNVMKNFIQAIPNTRASQGLISRTGSGGPKDTTVNPMIKNFKMLDRMNRQLPKDYLSTTAVRPVLKSWLATAKKPGESHWLVDAEPVVSDESSKAGEKPGEPGKNYRQLFPVAAQKIFVVIAFSKIL